MKRKNPRHGSMQFWPRKRAKRSIARVRSWNAGKDVKPLGFIGYKVGMTHMMAQDTSAKGNVQQAVPCTIIECPPAKILSVRFYKNNQVLSETISPHIDDATKKALHVGTAKKKFDEIADYDDIRLILYTQPKLTTTGKKVPDVFEIALGGKEKLEWVKNNLDKEISVKDVFAENTQVDAHVITKGKGYQGVIKRFGVSLKNHKSEKGQRRVGARSGAWKAQAHMMYRVAQPGKMGYHQRTEYNKLILKIFDKPQNPTSGFKRYGIIKTEFLVVKGSIGGAVKRAVTLTAPERKSKKVQNHKLKMGELAL